MLTVQRAVFCIILTVQKNVIYIIYNSAESSVACIAHKENGSEDPPFSFRDTIKAKWFQPNHPLTYSLSIAVTKPSTHLLAE